MVSRLGEVGVEFVVPPLANLDARFGKTNFGCDFDGSQTERFGGHLKSPFRPFLYVVRRNSWPIRAEVSKDSDGPPWPHNF